MPNYRVRDPRPVTVLPPSLIRVSLHGTKKDVRATATWLRNAQASIGHALDPPNANEDAFRIWLQRKPVKAIDREVTARFGPRGLPVSDWVTDWERGAQRRWNPRIPEIRGYLDPRYRPDAFYLEHHDSDQTGRSLRR